MSGSPAKYASLEYLPWRMESRPRTLASRERIEPLGWPVKLTRPACS
jgi:hypothetical protein